MRDDAAPHSNRLRAELRAAAPGIVLALVVFCALLVINRAAHVFEYDPDEGNNVIKALLVQKGFAYGTEIWTDQPPLFTYLLPPAFAVFGATMDVARGVVSAFSAVLVFGVYESVRRSVGHLGALTAVLLLLSSALYVLLSVSVMIGLPAIACSALALLLATSCGRSASPRALLTALGAGALAGAAAGIKLFTLPIVPVLLLTTLLGIDRRSSAAAKAASVGWRAWLKGASLRGAAFGGGFLLVALASYLPVLMADGTSGLFDTHQLARDRARGTLDGLGTLKNFVADDPVLFVLAGLGCATAILRRSWAVLPWLAWLVCVALALLDHSPVWTHHRLLLTVPAAALAGSAFVWPPTTVPRALRISLRVALPALGMAAICFALSRKGRLDSILHPSSWTNSEQDWIVFAEFERYAKKSRLVAAARPTFAFRAQRAVPPNLGVTSWKRFRVGLLSAKRVVKDIADSQPETLLLSSRWPGSVRAGIVKKIKKSHRRVQRWRHESTELWVSRKVLHRLTEPEERSDRTSGSEP